MSKLLTIGMATYDDYDGVYFTIQAIRMYQNLPENDYEFIVFDSNPKSPQGQEVQKFLKNQVKNSKYITLEENKTPSSFNKYDIVKYADGKYVLIIDCHVLLQQDAIKHLLEYYNDHPDCKDLVQGPLIYDDLINKSTQFDPKWSGHMYGVWHTDREKLAKGEPFEIPMQGMGLCSFEKSNWPGISPHFRGFGAEEGYIAEKFRLNGGKNICLPKLGWNHRFGRPAGVPYRLILEDRIMNYFIGWLEMYQDPNHTMVQSIYDYFKDKIPKGSIDNLLSMAKRLTNIK